MQDSLDKLIQLAQISGCIDVQCQFKGDWFIQNQQNISTEERYSAVVHIIVEGEGYLKVKGESQSHLLKAGDIIFFSRSQEHVLSSQYNCQNKKDLVQNQIKNGFQLKTTSQFMGDPELKLFCAHFYYDKRASLFHNLPEYFWTTLDQEKLQGILNLLQQELNSPNLGNQVVIDSLSKVLLVEIIRAYIASQPDYMVGILKGIQDPRLAVLIKKILNQPAENWSIEVMLQFSNLSRSQLTRIFKQVIGLSPHAFVHQIRLQQAATLLNNGGDSVFSIALSCGFQSEAHFIQAFKKIYNITPSQYRKQKTNCLK